MKEIHHKVQNLFQAGKYKDVTAYLEQHSTTEDLFLRRYLGQALSCLSQHQKALEILHEVQLLEENINVETLYYIANSHYALCNYTSASQYVDMALASDNFHSKSNQLLMFLVEKNNYSGKRYIPNDSNSVDKLILHTPEGCFSLRKAYSWVGKQGNFSLDIMVGLQRYSHEDLSKFQQTVQRHIAHIIQNQQKFIKAFVCEIPGSDFYDLAKVYKIKNKKSFCFEAYKQSMKLQKINLCYHDYNIGVLRKMDLHFCVDSSFTFGASHLIIDINVHDSDKFLVADKAFSYIDFEYDYQACAKVLQQQNEIKFSLFILGNLAHMEGVIHQGSLYSTTAAAADLLIPCITTCHPSAQVYLLKLLCYIKNVASEPSPEDEQHAKQVLKTFAKHDIYIQSLESHSTITEYISYLQQEILG